MDALSEGFNDLRSRGQGYVEVRLPSSEFRVLTLAFGDDRAIVHLMSDTARMRLLTGDGAVSSGAAVEVPIIDDLAAFTADCVLDTDRAWTLVHDFPRTRAAGPLGEWCEL